MEETRPAVQRSVAFSEAERDAICRQMEQMLANPLFKHSKRYPHLLRFVIERTLEGCSAELKERSIGVAVFGREPNYDTNADPIVRAAAGEVRKRIAQYYFEPGHEAEIRIDLTSGSYIPEFVFPALPSRPATSEFPAEPALRPAAGNRRPILLALPVVALALLVIATYPLWAPRNALDRFWGPVLERSTIVRLCVGQRRFLGASPEPEQPAGPDADRVAAAPITLFSLYYLGSQNVAFPDLLTIGRLTGLLQSKGKMYHIRGESFTSFEELRDGPVVLVGAFNNDWTLRLMGPLRFSFQRDGDTFWIRDNADPSKKDRAVNYSIPYMQLTRDYALISRVLEPSTERMVVVAAGLTGYGTIAAGEFLTTASYMDVALKHGPRNWERKNLQFVLSTDVIHGHSGPPRIIAQTFW